MRQTQRSRDSLCDRGQDDFEIERASTGLGRIQHEGQPILLVAHGMAHTLGEEVGEATRGQTEDSIELQDGHACSLRVVSELVENRR